MWLLENCGGAFQGRRLWLRPGKRYLFGRTRAEPGQLVISDKTISRKHLTINVDSVRDGGGRDCSARSVVTIEDLNTKIGTVVNGTQIRGQKFVLLQDQNEIKMGHMADLFRITWFPVVFSFSFTSKELRADPWSRLRDDLEQLDVKYLADYDRSRTTHVVAKKRNTSKGLQALINGKHIVAESFITALVEAATTGTSGAAPLEESFDASWPDALSHLPPRGDEPSDRPVSTYAPDARRRDVFDGYTFVFYDEKQYENLLGPISNAKGKALLGKVVPGVTEVDDFVRYIKGVAGETGLGEFEDGSMGKGVVVVRYLPAKGDHVDWFARFTTAVALRLDHRLIDQREFLDAILAVDPSKLRRPLEVEQFHPTPPALSPPVEAMVVDETPAAAPTVDSGASQPAAASSSLSQTSTIRRARARRGITSRFKGFDEDLNVGDDSALFPSAEAASEAAVPVPAAPADDEDDKMFVSQIRDEEGLEHRPRNPRKRGTPAPAEDRNGDIMDDIAPTAAAVKRQRIEAGVDSVPPKAALLASEEENEDSEKENGGEGSKRGIKATLKRGKGKDTNDTILEQARKNREAAEKRAAEERAELEQIPDDGVDADMIRKLTLVEEIAVVRRPRGSETAAATRRARDRAEGRWDPKWNGRRNFKRFRKQGDPMGRPAPRVIVRLEPAKTKEYGLGDDYWLEGGEDAQRPQQRDGIDAQNNSTAASSIQVPPTIDPTPSSSTAGRSLGARVGAQAVRGGQLGGAADVSDAEAIPDTEPEDNGGGGGGGGGGDVVSYPFEPAASGRIPETGPQPNPELDLPRTRAGKAATRAAAARQSQASQASQARAQRTTRSAASSTRGQDTQEADTQASSEVVFHTPLSTTTVAPAPTASATTAGKRTAPAAAASRPPPPKRPRRGAGLGGSSSMGSTPGTITLQDSDDDDDDDGLRFKFRSRR